MHRHVLSELLEDPSLSDEIVAQSYRELARTQRLLGNTAAVLRHLQAGEYPVRKVLDIGCGQGALLDEIRSKFDVEVIGFDIRPAPQSTSVPIVTGNAVVDPLPVADIALAICLAHHLSESDLIRLVQNVSRSCRRLFLLDLVRHRMPLFLFQAFVRPFLCRINAADGLTSIRRAYTPDELRALVNAAVSGSGARVVHRVAPLYIRQTIEIAW